LDADGQGADVVFKVEYVDPNQRLEREATPVIANFPMLFLIFCLIPFFINQQLFFFNSFFLFC